MSIEEFIKKYRIEPVTRIEGWGVNISYTIFDKEKGERVAFDGDVYGEFLRFHSIEEALLWADNKSK